MKTVELCVDVLHVTALGVRVSDGDVTCWLQKSQVQCDEELEAGKTVTIEIPELLAVDKELV